MAFDFSRCRSVILQDGTESPPPAHVREGVRRLIEQPYFMLADEMGAMKTAQVAIAAQALFEAGEIDRVLVIAPAAVRAVWYDPELGELARHLFTPSKVVEFHSKIREWKYQPETDGLRLSWIVTNYDFIRSSGRFNQLLSFCGHRTLLVLDESGAVKNTKALQTIACLRLRRACGRVVLMNGTPISNHPGDMFSQGNIMHPGILNCPSYTQFCARYAIMKPVLGPGGHVIRSKFGGVLKRPESWINIPDLQARFAPYVIRRLKSECLDLPDKLPSIPLTATLTPATWKIYKTMRDELVVWLSSATVSMAPQVITKIMRLSQVTSGFLGGVEDMPIEALEELDLAGLFAARQAAAADDKTPPPKLTQEIGREKLDVVLGWLVDRFNDDPNLKVLIWSRFRAEIIRLERELRAKWPHLAVGTILGGQSQNDRDAAVRLLDIRSAPIGPVVVIGNPASGGKGLNLTACHTVVYMSNDYSLEKRLQSEDRTHRAGQTSAVSYFDVVAVGPSGQRTIDHTVLATLLAKDELATFTSSAWVKVLGEE